MNKILPIILVVVLSGCTNTADLRIKQLNAFKDEIKILLKDIIDIEKDIYKITETTNDNFYHVVVDYSTHDRNYIYNVKDKKLSPIGDGSIEIKDDAIYRYWAKSYFDGGGAFWYNMKVNYSGEYIELIPVEKDAKCYSIDKFKHMSDEFVSVFKKQKLDKLCVWHK